MITSGLDIEKEVLEEEYAYFFNCTGNAEAAATLVAVLHRWDAPRGFWEIFGHELSLAIQAAMDQKSLDVRVK